MDTPTIIAIISSTGVVGLIGKLVYDGIKAERNGATKKDEIYRLCPFDKSGTIKTIDSIHTIVEGNEDLLKDIKSMLKEGVAVARRNTEHYEELVKTLASLVVASNVQTDALKDLIKENRRQTEYLIKISKNGS